MFPLSKTRDKTYLCNYRPISLLSVLSKLLEKHVHVQLNDYLEKHLLIHPFQSAFRCKHFCNTALVRLTHSWLTAMNRSDVSGVIFLNLKKAFDLVDHNIMMYKLGCYLQIQVLYRFSNRILKAERNVFSSMAHILLKAL